MDLINTPAASGTETVCYSAEYAVIIAAYTASTRAVPIFDKFLVEVVQIPFATVKQMSLYVVAMTLTAKLVTNSIACKFL